MTRRGLDPRRQQTVVQVAEFRGGYTISFGHYADGQVGEVFIDSLKRSSSEDTDGRDVAILISLAIQHGVPVDVMRQAVSREVSGDPAGIAGVALDLIASGQGASDV